MAKNTTGKANNGKTTTPQKRVYNRKPKAPTISETPTADSAEVDIKVISDDKTPEDYLIEVAEGRSAVIMNKKKHNNDTDSSLYNSYDKVVSGKTTAEMTKELLIVAKPNKFLTYKEFMFNITNNMANIGDSFPYYNHYNNLMEMMLRSEKINSTYCTGEGTTQAINEAVPSDKFTTIVNMVKYIQCKLDGYSYYIDLLKIDCIILASNGQLYLASSKDGIVQSDFRTRSETVKFNLSLIRPIISNDEIVRHSKIGSMMLDCEFKNTSDGDNIGKEISNNILLTSLRKSFERYNMTEQPPYGGNEYCSNKILAYWTKNTAKKLYPIEVINKTLEDKAYPIIFASECFIEK